MSGYERSAVIGMNDKDLDEFTCAICHEIFNTPVVTQCCRQTYCKACIEEWLTTQNTCPNDRKRLRRNELTAVPRFVINLLNNMQTKCQFYEKGCEVVTTIGQLFEHLKECLYRPDLDCKTCGLLKIEGKEHNCIESLIDKNSNLCKEIVELQNTTQNMRLVNSYILFFDI